MALPQEPEVKEQEDVTEREIRDSIIEQLENGINYESFSDRDFYYFRSRGDDSDSPTFNRLESLGYSMVKRVMESREEIVGVPQYTITYYISRGDTLMLCIYLIIFREEYISDTMIMYDAIGERVMDERVTVDMVRTLEGTECHETFIEFVLSQDIE